MLGAVFSLGLTGKRVGLNDIAAYLGVGKKEVLESVRGLEDRGLLKTVGGEINLTAEGRRKIRVVFIGGGFEIIHQGHLYTIEKARGLGDVLVVSVARDSTLRKRKGRNPVSNENQRLKLLSSLRQVDVAILGVEGDIYETLAKVRPDVVALGYDQYHLESEVGKEAAARGMKLRVVRLGSPYPRVKTTALLKGL